MTNMCHMFYIFISGEYMSRVFMYKWKYIYRFQIVVDEAPQQLSFQSLGVCWFYCGHWVRSTSSLSCRALVLMRLWVSFFHFCWCLVEHDFCYFFFIFVYWCLFSFFFPWRWRWVVTLFRLCDFVWKSWISFYWLKIWDF